MYKPFVLFIFFILLAFQAAPGYAKFRPIGPPAALRIIVDSQMVEGENSQTRLTTDQGIYLVSGTAAFLSNSVVYRLEAAMEDGSQHKTFICNQSFQECFLVLVRD